MRINKCFVTISLIAGMILLYSRCINSDISRSEDPRGRAYAGSSTCKGCHQEVYGSYIHTGHFQTLGAVTPMPDKSIFKGDPFVFNDSTTLAIEKRDSGIYQVVYVNGKDSIAKRFDTRFGSGAHALSFGYWQGKQLYQLPLSYFSSIKGWANSPGFPIDQPYFGRPITSRCFECHSSYVGEDLQNTQSLTQVRNLDKNSIIYGIDCERCHGPAANHVTFHTENPSEKKGHNITSWASLSRQQKLDVCGVCHSGNDLAKQKSTFSFIPGDTLSNFYYPELFATSSGAPDVHGNQSKLLAASECFRKSNSLECSSCHNVHASRVRDLESYSKQCISCHNQTPHNDLRAKGFSNAAIINNCIDCHMPKEASRLISYQLTGKLQASPYFLRTHRIAVYPEETKKVFSLRQGPGH